MKKTGDIICICNIISGLVVIRTLPKNFNFSPKSSPFSLSTCGSYCPKEIGYVQLYRYIKIISKIKYILTSYSIP